MLIGVAALSAWGLYRFNQIVATLPKPTGSILEIATGVAKNSRTAFAMQYGSIFFITTIVCLVGAVFALFIGGRQTHAEDISDEAAPDQVGWR
jgi:hypothetical protein